MKTLLFNPFEKYPEKNLLFVGVVFTLLGSWLAFILYGRYDGVLDLHFTTEIFWWQPFMDNLINVLCLTVFLFISAKIVNTRTRFVDILSASLVARLPYYLVPLFNINGYVSRATAALVDPVTLQIKDFSYSSLLPILIFSFFAFLVLAWYIILLYRGYKVASNAKGTKPVMLFIHSLVLAEILSKYLIIQFS